MAPVVSVKELYRRLVTCTFEDGKVRDLNTALEILKTLESTKMTVNDLQETRFGRLVNNIRRNNSEPTLCRQSKKLIRLWQRVASGPNDQQPNGGTPGGSQQPGRRGTTPGAAPETPSSSTKSRNPPKMASIAARSPAVSNGPTRGRPRKEQPTTPLPPKHPLRNGHVAAAADVTASRSASKVARATPAKADKRKINSTTPNSSLPGSKRARMTPTASNHQVMTPSKRAASERSSRKSERKQVPAAAKSEADEFTTHVVDNGLKIRIKKPPKTAVTTNTTDSTSGYQQQQTRPNGQQQNLHHHHHRPHHPSSPHSPDSIDSDRTTVDTPPDVTSRLRPPTTATTNHHYTSSLQSTHNHQASTPTTVTPASAGLAEAIFRPSISRASLPVHFEVTTDPFFCSTLQPTTEQRTSKEEGEIHGVNGCRGDNGKWYPWNEGILLKHRTQVVLNDQYDEGLLSILPYVEVE